MLAQQQTYLADCLTAGSKKDDSTLVSSITDTSHCAHRPLHLYSLSLGRTLVTVNGALTCTGTSDRQCLRQAQPLKARPGNLQGEDRFLGGNHIKKGLRTHTVPMMEDPYLRSPLPIAPTAPTHQGTHTAPSNRLKTPHPMQIIWGCR